MESIVIQAQAALKGLGPSSEELKKDKEPTEEEKRRTVATPAPPETDTKGKGKVNASEDNARLRAFW